MHGSAIQISYPERVSSVHRGGTCGTEITHSASSDNWLPMAVPVPAMIGGGEVYLVRTMVEMELKGDIEVTEVQVMDGLTVVAQFKTHWQPGKHFEQFDIQPIHAVKRGICINLCYEAGGDPDLPESGFIRIFGVGCQYRTP
jgi:hypothetical protein